MSSYVYACVYFDTDRSISVLHKSKCRLRGPFQKKEEVEVDWRNENGEKDRLIATIIKVGEKGDKKELESYADIAGQRIRQLIALEKSPKDHLEELCDLRPSSPLAPEENATGDHESIPKKRQRKETALMRESKDQEEEMNHPKRAKPTKDPKPAKSKKQQQKESSSSSAMLGAKEILNDLPLFVRNFPSTLNTSSSPSTCTSTTSSTLASTSNSAMSTSTSTPKPTSSPEETTAPPINGSTSPILNSTLLDTATTFREALGIANDFTMDGPDFSFNEEIQEVYGGEKTTGQHLDDGSTLNGIVDLEAPQNQENPDVVIAQLKKENEELKKELEKLKMEKSKCCHPAASPEVKDFLENLLKSYGNTGEEVLPLLPNPPTKAFSIRANLNPTAGDNKAKPERPTVRLLERANIFVDRNALRADITTAQKKGPSHLLGRLIASVFTTEELATSCGQGIVNAKNEKNGNKLPLDQEKINVCKDYVTAFCIENKKEHLTPKQVNEAITNQVSYARVKMRRLEKLSQTC